MFKQYTKSILRAAIMSCVMFFILLTLCHQTRAQSTDPANPTLITTSTVEGQAGPAGATYYYRFQAQKGSITVTFKGQTNMYSTQFEADVLNASGDQIGSIYVSAGDTAKSESRTLSFDSNQEVTIVVKLLKDDTVKWQKYSLTLSGAVAFGESGEGKKDNSPKGLPDLVFGKIEYEEGGKSPYPGNHTGNINFCVRNVGEAKAGQFQVRLTIYKDSDEDSGLWREPSYFAFKPLAPGAEQCQWVSFQSSEPIFVGRGRLLWIDPDNGPGMVKESNENNNKAWTNFPPKGVQ